jgi:hypothetical protein
MADSTKEASLREMDDMLSFVRAVARDEMGGELKCPELTAANAVRDAVFVGKKREPVRQRKPIVQEPPATWPSANSRPCSPSLFRQTDARKHVRGGTGAKPQRDLEETLTSVEGLMYPDDNEWIVSDETLLPPTHVNSLGIVLLPIRRKNVLEQWTLHEIAVFESAICLHGKRFDLISPLLQHKTTADVIAFYYAWKNSVHAKRWKETYKGDAEEGYGG